MLKLFVVTATLFIIAFRAPKISAWYLANKNILRDAGAQGLVAGLTAWFCFYALYDLIDWLDPRMFGPEPVGMIGTCVACAMAATYASWWVRSDHAKNVRGPARPDAEITKDLLDILAKHPEGMRVSDLWLYLVPATQRVDGAYYNASADEIIRLLRASGRAYRVLIRSGAGIHYLWKLI
jgi:hypothetical protein